METPLRERSGGHTGTAPTGSFGQIACGWLISFGWIVRKWLFCLCGIAWKNMMELGRGGACVPARVALQGRIRRSFPAYNTCIFSMETPLCERSGGHTGTAPTVSFGQIARGWFCLFVGKTVHMNQHHRCCTFVSPGLIERSEIYPG